VEFAKRIGSLTRRLVMVANVFVEALEENTGAAADEIIARYEGHTEALVRQLRPEVERAHYPPR
jgi:hypothetical protein